MGKQKEGLDEDATPFTIVLFVYFIVVIYDMNKIRCNVSRSRGK